MAIVDRYQALILVPQRVRRRARRLSQALSVVLVFTPFAPAAVASSSRSEDRTVVQVGKKHKSTDGWSRRKYGGPGSSHHPPPPSRDGPPGQPDAEPLDAVDDDCRDAPGADKYFWKVFENDRLYADSDVLWDDGNGRVQLESRQRGPVEEWGFLYLPGSDYSSYQFPYRLVSPNNADDYADATVTITFDHESRTC